MNKLQLYPDGHPLQNDDLIHSQTGVLEALQGLVSVLDSTQNIILSGCEISSSPSTISWNSGYIAFGGEVFYVPSGSFGVGAGTLFWAVTETVVYPSPVSYKNLVAKNVHLQRRMQLKYFVAGDQGFADSTAKRVPQVYNKFILVDADIAANAADILTNAADIATESGRIDSIEDVWLSTTPTVTPKGSMTIGSVTGSVRYKIVGKTMWLNFSWDGTVGGTLSNEFYLEIPGGNSAASIYYNAIEITDNSVQEIGLAFSSGTAPTQIVIRKSPSGNWSAGSGGARGQLTLELV